MAAETPTSHETHQCNSRAGPRSRPAPLDIVLRDCGIDTYVVVGIATEVGIEPTVRQSLDLGYLPIVVTDACGHGDAAAARRSLDTLEFVGGTLLTTTAELVAALTGAP